MIDFLVSMTKLAARTSVLIVALALAAGCTADAEDADEASVKGTAQAYSGNRGADINNVFFNLLHRYPRGDGEGAYFFTSGWSIQQIKAIVATSWEMQDIIRREYLARVCREPDSAGASYLTFRLQREEFYNLNELDNDLLLSPESQQKQSAGTCPRNDGAAPRFQR